MARLNPRSSSAVVGRTALSPSDSRHNTPSRKSRHYSPAIGSDKENPRRMPDKGKGRMVEPRTSTGRKRRRIGDNDSIATSSGEEESEPESLSTPGGREDDPVEDVTDTFARSRTLQVRDGRASGTQKTVRFYDQAQDEAERRELKRKSRKLERDFVENRDEYLKAGNDGLTKTIAEADAIFEAVKQTADATTDSRLMVSVSDIAHRKSTQLVLGDTATGIDVDEFVSKCISFMRRGGPSFGSTQRRRQQGDDEDEDEEELNWAHLGAQACFPYNSRPGVPSFILGPLSVQKRQRQVTQRRARLQKDDRAEVAPEALEKEDLASGETNTVRYACAQIKQQLMAHCDAAIAKVEAEQHDDMDEDEVTRLLRTHRITRSGGPSLFDFAVNPRSFGQTVENLFYISFLIKEGEVGVDMGDDGLPALVVNTETSVAARARKSTRHQAVFGLDHATWRDLVAAFDMREPLIPHRRDETAAQHVGAKGWYS